MVMYLRQFRWVKEGKEDQVSKSVEEGREARQSGRNGRFW